MPQAATHIAVYRHERHDMYWLIGLQGLNYLVPLLVWPYLMHVLGAEGFGAIGLATSLCQALMLLVDFGFNLTASKAIALVHEEKEQVSRIFSNTLTAKLLLLAGSIVVVAGVGYIPRYEAYSRVCWIMWLMVVGNTFSMQWLFQGLGKIRLVSIVNCACRLLVLPLTFVWVKTSDDVMIAAGILAATYLLSGIIMVGLTQYLKLVDKWHVDWQGVCAAIQDSTPVFISTALSSVYALLYVLILGYFATQSEVGHYAAVEKVMRVSCYLFLLPVLQSFYPKVSQLAQSNAPEAHAMMIRLVALLSVVMIGIGIVLYWLSTPLMQLLGKDYAGTELVFKVMAAIPLMISWSGVVGQLGLLAQGGDREKRMFRNVYAVTAIFSMVLIGVMASQLTATKAAAALLATEAVAAIGMIGCYYKIKRNQ